MKNRTIIVALFALLLQNTACTYTSTSQFSPKLKQEETLSEDLNKTVTCEGININGVETTVNGVTTNELVITVSEPKDLPKGVFAKQPKAKKIAKLVSEHLEKKRKIDIYTVTFLYQDGSSTERQNVQFQPSELK